MVSILNFLDQYSVWSLSLIRISGIDWKFKTFRGFRVFVLSYRVKTKAQNQRNFYKRSFQEKKGRQSHFFCNELIVKSFNSKKLVKKWGKRAFLKYWKPITRVQKIHFRSLQVIHYNTYGRHETSLRRLFLVFFLRL